MTSSVANINGVVFGFVHYERRKTKYIYIGMRYTYMHAFQTCVGGLYGEEKQRGGIEEERVPIKEYFIRTSF